MDADRRRSGASESAAGAGPAAGDNAFTVRPTPDDGVRRSASLPWDESTRPSGPPPDPSRRYTAAELASGRHLVDVHDHLRAELRRVQAVMAQVLAGETDPAAARSQVNATAIRQNNWTLGAFCQGYCRLVTGHHTLENAAMFPRLREMEQGLRPVIDRLEQEHLVIHEVLEELDRALVAFVTEPADVTRLRTAVELLGDTLLSHLAYEERELVEPLARLGVF